MERAVRAAPRRAGRDARRRWHRCRGGAITAKVVDIGVTDEFVDQLREMVRPGTTTVALLADGIDPDAVLAELARFEGARYVTGNLSLDAIQGSARRSATRPPRAGRRCRRPATRRQGRTPGLSVGRS